jgi:hypothetical protein
MVPYEELLAATVTAERTHLLETCGFLSALTLLYCHCSHLLNCSEFPLLFRTVSVSTALCRERA